MKYNALAIAGLPKSGKTAIIRELKKSIDWKLVHVGGIFRKMHKEWKSKNPQKNKLSFEKYYEEIVTDKEVIEANNRAKNKLKKGKIILDSRFASVNAKGVDSVLLILITASLKIRTERSLKAKAYKGSKSSVSKILQDRENEEVSRGKRIYGGFDYTNPKHYELILDTSKKTIQEEVKIILDKLNKI